MILMYHVQQLLSKKELARQVFVHYSSQQFSSLAQIIRL